MTSIQLPQMYASSAVHFHDPFESCRRPPPPSWTAFPPHSNFGRALTPPPEMKQEYGPHYGDQLPTHQAYYAPVAPHQSQDVFHSKPDRQITSRPPSPVRQPVFEEVPSRRGSHASSIAPSFQIPRSVNDSGGSLSELAAQITCLFWFESADLLQLVEDSDLPAIPFRPLTPDARPTTGFRKWVTTILSTTLVAQNVVLLALLFVYRLKKLNPTVKGKPGSEYRLLTVALMLGNKFLDDNTYTNKTWAEVSGINVGEVHIMEVEFLSNMKYCLFTSAEDWTKWQSLLGRFASFFERASKPAQPAPILPPAASIKLSAALPSPPSSNQASPPHFLEHRYTTSLPAPLGLTPAPSPLSAPPAHDRQPSRKRSLDDGGNEPPSKRIARAQYLPPRSHALSSDPVQSAARLNLPSLPISGTCYPTQLPPLHVPARVMGVGYPIVCSQGSAPVLTASAGVLQQVRPDHSPKQHSPLAVSASASPGNAVPTPGGRLHPAPQISPKHFLQQRNSPYRPVRNVSTLLYPPPSGALHQQPHCLGHNQMAYQQLGKPIQQRQTGRLPYVSQNIWLDSNGPQAMTPVHQWPGFAQSQQQLHIPPQH